MRHIVITVLALMIWGSSHTQCNPTDNIFVIPAFIPSFVIPPGNPAPVFMACDTHYTAVDFGEVFASPTPILLVGFCATWQASVDKLGWLQKADTAFGIKHFVMYVQEAYPDTSCPDSTCTYNQFSTCPHPVQYCQQHIMSERRISAIRAINGYTVTIILDNSLNEWWNKYQNLPHAGYLIKDGIICKSWQNFDTTNFAGYLAQCLAMNIEEEITLDYIGTAYDGNAIKWERMSYGDWIKSDWIWFSDGVRKYRRE